MLIDRLLTLMEEQDLDQQVLAAAAGCSQVTISKILSGRITNSRFLPQIASVLGVNEDWLRGTSGVQRHTPAPIHLPSEEALCLMFQSLLVEIPRDTSIDIFARALARRFPSALTAVQQVAKDASGELELVADDDVHGGRQLHRSS